MRRSIQDAYAYHTMSHTTLLIDRLGQAQPGSGEPLHPFYARVAGFETGPGYTYFAGDTTNAYPRGLEGLELEYIVLIPNLAQPLAP